MLLTPEIHDLIDRALQEDLGIGDATTAALVPPTCRPRRRCSRNSQACSAA